ncbi:MAG: YdeI/OmpD-associated family protein [Polymorphobacter sp.]
MPRDDRVTAYIGKAPPFAQPILATIRERMHSACPELDEAIKWSMPFFVLDGAPIANMAAFKAHAAFGFWQREAAAVDKSAEAMGQFGKLTSIADVPEAAALAVMVAQAIVLAKAGAKTKKPPPGSKPALDTPVDLDAALAAVPAAVAGFAALPPGARREYVEWVVTAKQPTTREKRIATTVAQVAEGKKLHWRYENC